MKNSIKVLVTLLVITMPGMVLKAQNAKTVSGVYLTENDYKNNKLSYILESSDKLRLNEFLDGRNIDFTFQGKKVKLAKSSIFGVRIKDQIFRFYHNDAYKILDTAGFILYSKQKLTQGPKGNRPVEGYFYSVDNKQPVLDLTIINLWNSFPERAEFRYSMRSYFHNDAELISFDHTENQYELKHLFFEHKKMLAAHI